MKLVESSKTPVAESRAPYGARGLKQNQCDRLWIGQKPRPVRGAWVETLKVDYREQTGAAAPRTGRVG